MKKGVTILGATGSVGRNALAVIDSLRDHFSIVGLTACRNAPLLRELIERYHPRYAALADEEQADALRSACPGHTRVLGGLEGVISVAAASEAQIVLSAIVGAAGLQPVLAAIKKGRTIALANKEPLVMAGGIITGLAQNVGATLLPVDSEHSAIFQCLCGNREQKIHKIVLTASGGPFYNTSTEALANVTPEQALAHPTWSMGAKISVDSATLMNKGLEVIEAHWLFGVDVESIEVVIHPTSVVHSMVEFLDGSIIAQLGRNDMKLPIQFALTYPDRMECPVERLDITEVSPLEFFPPKLDKFPCLALAYEAAKVGGTMPAVLNAANEVAVDEFLQRRLHFQEIPTIIERVMRDHQPVADPRLGDILAADEWARESAMESQRSHT
ncbi:MAG: 1-deoxy-D-xylulose-5-phosphate reductoisomerase [Candidatus Abyssobacteria bacterium SURF_17]|uniref:1-deoxy-D-xylulose 5-phosphate reductoisomerase n=1 Tax=Candidatus Abyssobacteria bacterium SURF_17 TaxID=2093361 RepID=A0A419F9N2_9BACT|nr:MAG: 1-deoxy-D-xylulose-5-phosphate reductoisomerase [Candidatus Abyssubacteria bacterium SURF_17]